MIDFISTSPDIIFFQKNLEGIENLQAGWEEAFLYYLGNNYLLSDVAFALMSKKVSNRCKEALVRGLSHSSEEEIALLMRSPNFSIGNSVIVDLLIGTINRDSYHDIFPEKQSHTGVRKHTKAINQAQISKILGNNGDLEIPEERTLNFYYRENEGDYPPHFDEIIVFLANYIKAGKSKVWTNFRVITRDKVSDELLYRLPDINIEYKTWTGFTSQATFFSDTISLTHGSLENIPGTHHIIGSAINVDHKKTQDINPKDMTNIDLFYYGGSSTRHLLDALGSIDVFPETSNELSTDEVIGRVLAGITKAEEKIIGKLQSENEKVHNVLNP